MRFMRRWRVFALGWMGGMPLLWSKEAFQFRLILGLIVLFIASAVTSCQEIRYTIFGTKADATIVDAAEVRGRRSSSLRLTYSFTDGDAGTRVEKDTVALDFMPVAKDAEGRDAVAIEFISGSPGASRIPGEGRWILIGLFLVAMGALAFVTVRFWTNYQAFAKRRARDD